jgi:hypothetical protein
MLVFRLALYLYQPIHPSTYCPIIAAMPVNVDHPARDHQKFDTQIFRFQSWLRQTDASGSTTGGTRRQH